MNKTRTNAVSPTVFPFLVLLILIAAGVMAFIWYASPGPPSFASQPPPERLTVPPSQTPAAHIVQVPSWIFMLVGGFVILQLWPIMIAAHKARRQYLSASTVRAITYLCETPMYLGLMGSLLGVCLTQFTTGSLSAPLAYLTTITGILLYLYAKFAILVSMPMHKLASGEERDDA